MQSLDYLYFNGKSSTDFQAYITDAGVYSSPGRNYEKVSVPGRNGDILFEQYKHDNIEHSYPVIIVEDFDRNFDALKSFLLASEGYAKLKDSYHPDEYYMATFSRVEDVKTTIYQKMGSCLIVFDRKPQKFLVNGDKAVTFTSFPATIKNPTQFRAFPLIRLYGSGTLTINGVSLVLNTSASYVDIDCELQEALQAGENLHITLSNGEFPKLSKGINTINWTGSRIDITPRWYRI